MASKKETKPKRKAKVFLVRIYKLLDKNCGKFETASNWYSFVKSKIDPLIENLSDSLDEETLENLKNSTRLIDNTKDGIDKTCNLLKGKIGELASAIPGTALGTTIAASFIAVSVLAGIAVFLLSSTSSPLTIINTNCPPINLPARLPVRIPSLSLPDNISLATDSRTVIKLPPLSFSISSPDPYRFDIAVLGQTIPVNLNQPVSVSIDGKLINAEPLLIRLKSSPHEIVISCLPAT